MSYILNKQNQKIAYRKIIGNSPGIIFIHGYNSDMSGKKALHIEKYAKKKKLSFLRFDCRGHGKSHGTIKDFVISDWKKDLLEVINKLTKGPQILVGSSMGGWLMLLAAKEKPSSIYGLIGLAAAPDFTRNLYKEIPKKNQKEILTKEITKVRKWNFNYTFTKKLFSDGKKNFILGKKINIKKPIVLIHGLKDNTVSSEIPMKIQKKVTSRNVIIKYVKNGDHSLSKKKDLEIILNSLDELIQN